MLHRSFSQFRIHRFCSLTFNNFKWGQNHGSGVHSPRYFHTTHSVINCPHQIHLPFQISWSSIAKWYEEDSWRSNFITAISIKGVFVHPSTPMFWCSLIQISFGGIFHPHCFSWKVGQGQGGVPYFNWLEDKWRNHQHGDPHHWWGQWEGLRSGDSFSVTLIRTRWRPVMPFLFYTNTTHQSLVWLWSEDILTLPTSLWGQSIHSIWMWSLSLGKLPWCISHWTGCICTGYFLLTGPMYYYHTMQGKKVWRTYPHVPVFLWDGLEEEHHLSDPISMSVTLPTPPPQLEEGTQTKGGLDSHPASIQTEGGQATINLSKLLQDNTQAWAQQEYELTQEAQELAKRYECKWAKQFQGHSRRQLQLMNQTEATFQEVFSQVDSMEAVKLLPWCVTVAMPLWCISGAVATAIQLVEGIPSISELCPTEPKPEPCGSPPPGPSRVLTSPWGTSPPLVPSIPDIPLLGTSLVGQSCPLNHLLTREVGPLSQWFTWQP